MDQKRLAANRWLVLGRAGMDFYADPPGARVEEAQSFRAALGGSAANVAVGIVKLGGQASLLTTVSSDAVGAFVRAQLARYGVGAKHVRSVAGEARTSLAVLATRADDTQSTIYRNDAADFQLCDQDAAEVDYEAFGAISATGTALAKEPSRSATFLAAARAKQAGCAIVFDVDHRPYSWTSAAEASQCYRRFAALCDVVVGNDEEFAVMAQGADGEALARQLAGGSTIVVYKIGARGAKVFDGAKTLSKGVYPTLALKPTGAGDAFLAGFANGLALGQSLERAAERGAAAAAIVVSRVGCAPAMPDARELDEFMASRSPLPFL